MNHKRTKLLVRRYLDREASEAEMAELQSLLLSNQEARELFWNDAQWHALYRQWGEQEWGRHAAADSPAPVVPQKRPALAVARRPRPRAEAPRKVIPFGRWTVASGMAAAAIILLLGILTHLPVATLERQANAKWSDTSIHAGDRLKPGPRHRLDEGIAVITFNQGARLVIEGPAEFEVLDKNSLELLSGRIRARAPASAHGFTVKTPSFTAVDVGTEFGCFVASDGSGELHVFEGQVDLKSGPNRQSTERLHTNEAMRIDRDTAVRIPAEPLSFPGKDEDKHMELLKRGDYLGAWRVASLQISRHPAAIFHLDFEETANGVLRNRARQQSSASDAAIHGSHPAEGRWPGKGALAFSSNDDGLEFQVPGEFESLTLTAWLKPAHLQPRKNPIVMGQTSEAGEVTWYFYGSGGLGVGVLSQENGKPQKWHNFHSDRLIPRHGESDWIFAAVVLDGRTGTATHYFNGEPVASETDMFHPPLQLRRATSGNLSFKELRRGDKPDHSEGAIDELTIFSTALPQGEIRRLYKMGAPTTP